MLGPPGLPLIFISIRTRETAATTKDAPALPCAVMNAWYIPAPGTRCDPTSSSRVTQKLVRNATLRPSKARRPESSWEELWVSHPRDIGGRER